MADDPNDLSPEQIRERVKAGRTYKRRHNGLGDETEPGGGRAERSPPARFRFPLLGDDDLQNPVISQWAIKHLLPAAGLHVAYGAPSCGKSFMMLHAALHIAAGLDYAGHRAKKRLVIYIAAEGQSNFINRVIAARAELGLHAGDALFRLIIVKPNLGCADGDAADMIADIRAQIGDDCDIGAIIIDTVSRTMGGANENNEGMANFVDNAGLIADAFQCLVSAIHHTGKDEKQGKRGWSGLGGATDCEWEFSKGVVIVRKMRDGADGWTWKFQLKQVKVMDADGEPVMDEDGDPVTTCIVELQSNPMVDEKTTAKIGNTREMPRSLRECMQAIDEALIDGGQHYRPGGDGPIVRAVPLQWVRAAFAKRWAVDDSDVEDEPEKKRKHDKAVSKAFNEALGKLPRRYCFEKTGKGGGWIWKVEK